MAFSINVINNIRANASAEFQSRIPEATKTNIAQIGNTLATYTNLYNEFCEALVNKIGKTILEQKLFKNKLAGFKSGTVATAQDVEEIFIEMAKAESAYDKDGTNPLGRRNPPDVKVMYHRLNRQDCYAISIGDIDFIRVFRSPETLDSFISSLISSVYSGASYDEWLLMKDLIATYDGYIYADMAIADPTPEGIAHALLSCIRDNSSNMSFPSRMYNGAGVNTWCAPEDQVLFIPASMLNMIDINVLAKTYNMGKTDIPIQIIPVDDLSGMVKVDAGNITDTPVVAILADKNWLKVWDTLSHMEPQRNAQGLFTNYFYHVHQILSASKFKNALAICAAGM